MKIQEACIIFKKPWYFTVYQVNKSQYFIEIPYSPKSFVDSTMMIEINNKKIDEEEVTNLSIRVRDNPEKYIGLAIDPKLQLEITKAAS